jgi:alpha/beta superfamily hydrolase
MSDDLTSAGPTSFTTADGLALEGEWRLPEQPRAAAVITHPHPLHGGNMTALVTGALFTALTGAGLAVLRFNFRGVGASEGSHDEGRGERLDVIAAIDTLAGQIPAQTPLLLAGWSFGADVALAVAHPAIAGWFAVAAPLRTVPLDEISAAEDSRPKLFAVPQHDQFRPPDSLDEVVADWPNTRIEVVAGADHFLVGRTDVVARLAVEFSDQLPANT